MCSAATVLLFSACCTMAAVATLPAQAHDAWVDARGIDFVVRYGHGAKTEAYAPAKVQQLSAIDAEGRPLLLTRHVDGQHLRFTASATPALLALHFDNGYWSKTGAADARSQNVAKNDLPGAVTGSHSVKYGKTIVRWTRAVLQPMGLPLEIVPTGAQAPVAGGTVAVQVLWHGQPLAGTRIGLAADKDNRTLTDAQGHAVVPVGAGRQMLVVQHSLPLPGDPRADKRNLASNLLFDAR